MRKSTILGSAAVFLFACSAAVLACEGPGADKCAGKDPAKGGAVQASVKECGKEGTACQKFAALKEGEKCGVLASICPEKAQALARKVRAESCPVKSAAILASALPGLKCETARANLVADVKGKACEKEAGQMILAAVKGLNPPVAATAAKEGAGCPKAAALASAGKEGATGCAKEGAVLAKAEDGKCGGKPAALAAAGKEGATGCAKEGAVLAAKAECCSFCPLKAEKLASAIRSESCCDRSATILAEALPDLKCKETLAKLVTEIKEKDCSHEAAGVILAASAKYTKKAEPVAATN